MNDRELDRITEAYIAALDTADIATLDRIWELAAADQELEAYLCELEAEIDADDKRLEEQALRQPFADAVRTHLKSAEIVEQNTGPVTVGDVARELVRNPPGGLPAEAYALIEQLQNSQEPLPENLGLSNLTAWAQQRFSAGPISLWKAFQQQALKLERRRASEVEYQLAARRGSKPEEPK